MNYNIYISHFYNIRFFPKNLVPVSTAVWDPKWYHENHMNDYKYIDKRGVWIGNRIEELSPAKLPDEVICQQDCKRDLQNCMFLSTYQEYLDRLDFKTIKEKLDYISVEAQKELNLENPADICLIVYEKPDNPCSERFGIIEFFAEEGINIKEFEPSDI